MSDIASPLFQWLNTHPELAGLATFFISAAESVAIIGTIVPGSVMMTAIGALVGAGIIPFWLTMIWAILGAIVGDGISYWIGYYFKDDLNNIWPFRKHPTLLESGKGFFQKHGAKSVFIGRFVGPVRALVPLVAGMLDVSPWRFTMANVTSALGWAPAYMLPGILIGAASVELPSEIATRVILMLVLAGLFILLCIWLLKKIFELIQKEVNQFLIWIWNFLEKSRYFHLLASALKHYDKTKPHGQLTLGFYFILTCLTLLYFLSIVIYQGPQNLSINNIIFHFFRSIRTPAADNLMLGISFLGQKYVLLPISFTLFAWFTWTRRMHTAWHTLSLGLVTAAGVAIAKSLTHIQRPWGVLDKTATSQFSFPSGHTTLAIVFYMAIALLIIKMFNMRAYRQIIYSLTGTLITAIILSRLYFGVHWFTDIVLSSLLGAAILMFFVLSYNRSGEKNIQPKGVIVTILITLMITYSLNLYSAFNQLKYDYTMLPWPTHTVIFDDWWQQQGENFPLYRINRLGLSTKTFNIQWIDNLEKIQQLLLQNGWEEAPKYDWLRVLYRITAVQSTEHLPLVSPTYLDKAPTLVFIKHINGSNKLLVLRFWNSFVRIKNLPRPLWMGSVELAPSTYSWLFKSKHNKEVVLTSSLLFTKPLSEHEIKQITVIIKMNHHAKNQVIILIKPKNF
jgi:membrane protein DedA with SNARE-associated domain/membrane-associated phospholipid phosphatase